MTIGLYDIDFHHSPTHFPNLELMKIYNYHYKKQDKVIFMTPKMDKGRFNEIIYFKEQVGTKIPKTLEIDMMKDHIYGYGFYKHYTPLNQKYQKTPPLYYIYEPYSDKISKDIYGLIKNHSFIRLESNDFTGFKPEAKKILLADNNFSELPNAFDFLQEYKDYKIILRQLHIIANTPEQAIQFSKCKNIKNQIYINFPYDYNFFLEYYQSMIFHLDKPFPNENENHYVNRIVRTILFYKSHNAALPFFYNAYSRNHRFFFLIQWGLDKTSLSYSNFYKNNVVAQNLLFQVPSEIRLLLKTNPQGKANQTFDLCNYV